MTQAEEALGMMNSSEPSVRAVALREELFGADFTVAEVAHILGRDRTTVLRYIHDFRLFAYELGGEWHIPEDEIRAFRSRLLARRKGKMRFRAVDSRKEEQRVAQAQESTEMMSCSRCGRFCGPEDLCNACEQEMEQAWDAELNRRADADLLADEYDPRAEDPTDTTPDYEETVDWVIEQHHSALEQGEVP